MTLQSNTFGNRMFLNSIYTVIEDAQRLGVVNKDVFDTLIREYAGELGRASRYSSNHNALNYFGNNKVQEVDVSLKISGS